MDVGHTRAWARRRRSGPISTICRRRWQHDNATGAVALLQSGCALPARGHGPGETYLSTGGKATYRDRNAVAGNRATSTFLNFLIPKLPAPREKDLSKGILEAVDMDSYRVEVQASM